MSLFFRIGIFVILIFGIVFFNRVIFTPLVEGHGGGGGGHMGIRRGGAIGYGAAAGYGVGRYYGGSNNYYGGENDYGFYDYYPPAYGQYSYGVYGNPIVYYV